MSVWLFLCFQGAVATLRLTTQVSPVQKVLELLSNVEEKVSAELSADSARREEFSRWCSEAEAVRGAAVANAAQTAKDLAATAAEAQNTLATLQSESDTLAAKVQANRADLKTAAFLRDEEHRNFAATENELGGTVVAIDKARDVLKKQGVGPQSHDGVFMAGVHELAGLVESAWVDPRHKNVIQDVVSGSTGETPRVVAALMSMRARAERTLTDARAAEGQASVAFNLLKQGLEAESALMVQRLGEVKAETAVYVTSAKSDSAAHDAVLQGRDADAKYLTTLRSVCAANPALAQQGAEVLKAVRAAVSDLGGKKASHWGDVADAAHVASEGLRGSKFARASGGKPSGVMAPCAHPGLRQGATGQRAEWVHENWLAKRAALVSILEDTSVLEMRRNHHVAALQEVKEYKSAAASVATARLGLDESVSGDATAQLEMAAAGVAGLATTTEEAEAAAQKGYDQLRAVDEVAKTAKTVELHGVDAQVKRLEGALQKYNGKGADFAARELDAMLLSLERAPCAVQA